jgi:hypothetical protein
MAQLAKTVVVERIPFGNKFISIFEFTPGVGAANEWIDTGFSNVLAAKLQAQGPTSVAHNVQLNAQGTGAAKGSSKGDLGVESQGGVVHTAFVVGEP